MMPSASGSLDPGGIDVEAVDSIDGPPPRPTASADDRSNADDRPAPDRRVRDDAPAAERDLPEDRVERLADEVAALEAEVAALEAEIESKERQRQQVIDNYESIVAAQRTSDRSSESTPDTSTEADGRRPLAALASRVGQLTAWLRRRE
jgi:predicted RNase H-like nuclease (RuvC/YqgF family)